MNKNPLEDYIKFISSTHGEENWVSVYKKSKSLDSSDEAAFYCALVSQENTKNAMNNCGWDLMFTGGGPGFVIHYSDGNRITSYHTSSDDGFKRIVLYRDFYGRIPNYMEISEEFKLFHNLHFDTKTSTFIAFDESGDEVEIIKMLENEIKIRKNHLKSFMAATQFNLLLYFEITKHFKTKIDFTDEFKTDVLHFKTYSGESYEENFTSFTRILGKKLIQCDSMENCGVWPYERPKQYEEFIIGGDIDSPITFSSDPDKLSNYFGANPGAPHFLTPVFFKKDVMQKYYGSSDYEINDGRLIRHGAWTLRLDNNNTEYISVFLGDLGQDLPSKEQTYWKSFNIIPDGHKISETNFQRSFLGNFYDPENPEHQFKFKYNNFNKEWVKLFGWPLFLPLKDNDTHCLYSIRSMLTNEQFEFDAMILAITKVTIDSINVDDLKIHLGIQEGDSKSIDLLDILFKKYNLPDSNKAISLLRNIQTLRSTGVAHRKGTNYDKIITKLGIDDGNYRKKFDNILFEFVKLLDELSKCTKK